MQLKDYYPPFLLQSRIFTACLESRQPEHDALAAAIPDIINQCFVLTATWGLAFWEKELAIPTVESKPIAYRRSVILAKLRGAGTTTKAMIENAAAAYSNGEVEVTEYPAQKRFVVKFVGQHGIPPNMADLTNTIEIIKPAHLGYGYEYRYLIWDELDARAITWDELDALGLTWDQFEEGAWLNA